MKETKRKKEERERKNDAQRDKVESNYTQKRNERKGQN